MKNGVVFGAIGLVMAVIAVLAAMNMISLPSLEDPACDAARDATKRFYSFHFGNGTAPSEESLKTRERFITRRLAAELGSRTVTSTDYFTATDDYPKAFRVGGCRLAGAGRTELDVALFWRDDERSEQRAVKVTSLLGDDGEWRVDAVESAGK
jgi:hypothetical protein